MQKRSHNLTPEAFEQARAVFRVVVVYEDVAASRRSVETCNFLIEKLGGAAECRTSMWKFDLLDNSKLQEIAAAEAGEADAIIVASAGGSELPAAIRSWFERWIPRRHGRAGALVALIDNEGGWAAAASPVGVSLAQFAARAGLDFIPHQGRLVEFTGRVTESASADSGIASITTISVAEPTPVQHWGLNE